MALLLLLLLLPRLMALLPGLPAGTWRHRCGGCHGVVHI
jgi:hypothetical protein